MGLLGRILRRGRYVWEGRGDLRDLRRPVNRRRVLAAGSSACPAGVLMKRDVIALARQAWVLSSLVAALALRADQACARPEGEKVQYEYREDLKPVVGLLRQGRVALGHLDPKGNFLPLPKVEPIDPRQPFSGPAYTIINRPTRPNEPVYEFRSGLLVKGKLTEAGDFVPDEGGKVIALRDYRYGKEAPRIYNLPGKFVERKGGAPPKGK